MIAICVFAICYEQQVRVGRSRSVAAPLQQLSGVLILIHSKKYILHSNLVYTNPIETKYILIMGDVLCYHLVYLYFSIFLFLMLVAVYRITDSQPMMVPSSPPQEHMTVSGGIFDSHTGLAAGCIQEVGARDPGTHLEMHWTTPAINVSSAKFEKL